MFKILKIGLSFLFLLAFTSSVRAVTPLDVVINEIAWMGTEISYNDEWIELLNNTNETVNLDGWILKAGDGTPEINLTGTIPAKSFYLLKRTDNEAVPGISADQIYTGALNNEGENFELYDNSGNLIDQINCFSGWFAGDNETKATMEKKDFLASGNDSQNWQTSQDSGGTPGLKNSFKTGDSQEEKEPETKEEALVVEEKTIAYSSNIFINEILPSPEGPDAENEWIEIFNQNSFEVNLSGWQINDTVGTTKTYIFPKETIIGAEGFLILPRPTTKITLNNSGDSLSLLQPDGNIVDKISYEKASQGESFNRTNSEWLWSSTLTPGAQNVIPSSPKEISHKELGKPLEAVQAEEITAEIGKRIPESSNFSFILFIALVVAFLSGITIFFVRKFARSKQLDIK